MEKLKFYYCKKCKNLFSVLTDAGVTPVCCGDNMILLTANTEDASNEKHVPAITRNGKDISVVVGAVPHPMLAEHWIQWIIVQQGNHIQRVNLNAGDEPAATFTLKDADAPITVYEHCNLHGLWIAEA